MRGQLILSMGVFFVALALGYMIGGSGTPVLGAIAPAIFGLVAAALSLVASGRMPNMDQGAVDVSQKTHASAPARVGIVLTIFATAFIFGSIIGAMARTQHWFAPKPSAPPSFPWEANELDSPPTIESALQWIGLQKALLERGYTVDRINVLYAIQSAEWQRLADQSTDLAGAPQESIYQSDIDLDKFIRNWNVRDRLDNTAPFSSEVPHLFQEQNWQRQGQ